VQLLDVRLAAPEQLGLRVVLRELLRLAAHLVAVDRLREAHEPGLRARLQGAAARQRVRLVRHAAAIDRLAVEAVALVVVDADDRGVDRDLVEVRPAEARDLRVDVRMDAAGEQRVVAEVDARHDVRGAERDLLGLGEEVVRIAVQRQLADRLHRHQLLRNDLGRIEHVEAEALRLRLTEHLHAELVLGVVAGLDRLPQVATVEVRVRAGDLHGLVPDERMRARSGVQWNFTNVDAPCAFTKRNVCTPKPCIVR
jgi:hypothetical protein